MNDEDKRRYFQKLIDEKTLCFNKSLLKARGWTEGMIRDLLAEIEIKTSPTCGMLTFQYYYEVSRVEAVEKTKEFKDRKDKLEQRRQAINKV